MNILEVVYDAFKPYLKGEKQPLNILEASNLWMFLAICNNTLRNEEVAINTVYDSELKKVLQDARDIHKTTAEEINTLLKEEGIPLPKDTSEKPYVANIKEIPEGARFNDEEIANLISFNLLLGVTYAARGLTEAIRSDVGYIYLKVILRKSMLSVVLKDLMHKREWLRIAPVFKK